MTLSSHTQLLSAYNLPRSGSDNTSVQKNRFTVDHDTEDAFWVSHRIVIRTEVDDRGGIEKNHVGFFTRRERSPVVKVHGVRRLLARLVDRHHIVITQALLDRDPEQAARLMSDHWERVCQDIAAMAKGKG